LHTLLNLSQAICTLLKPYKSALQSKKGITKSRQIIF
jgi:hypothetical protein